MKILVTGATGLIGSQLAQRLAGDGHQVHALYRSEGKIKELAHPNIQIFKGDVTDMLSIEKAAEGCQATFHLAAYAKMWAEDPNMFYEVNVKGTENVLRASQKLKVKRFVLTSTAGVFGPSVDGIITEETRRKTPFFNAYEETKAAAEEKALAMAGPDFEVVIVNPTRVYGPGLLSESNGVTRLVKMYLEKPFGMVPGSGRSVGNYVFIDDVVEGLVRAWGKGQPSERYLLGGENVSFNDLFRLIAVVSGNEKPLVHIPLRMLLVLASFFKAGAAVFGKAPLITPSWVRRYLRDWEVSNEKAVTELGCPVTPMKEGLQRTCDWLIKNQLSD